jgi:hypothetical protein
MNYKLKGIGITGRQTAFGRSPLRQKRLSAAHLEDDVGDSENLLLLIYY